MKDWWKARDKRFKDYKNCYLKVGICILSETNIVLLHLEYLKQGNRMARGSFTLIISTAPLIFAREKVSFQLHWQPLQISPSLLTEKLPKKISRKNVLNFAKF